MKLFLVIPYCSILPHLVQPLKFLRQNQPAPPAQVPDAPVGSAAGDLQSVLDRFQALESQFNKLGVDVGNLPMMNLTEGTIPDFGMNSSAPNPFAGDPALSVASEGGGGDYFTKAYTSENIADPHRGDGGCTAWRATLQCNPSGVRDTASDKTCDKVIGAGESGFCECGHYAQFAAVDCSHRPFTCETMCLKFALISHKQAYYKGQALTPLQAESTMKYLMWANQTDLESMRVMTNEMIMYINKAIGYTLINGHRAKKSIEKFKDMMKKSENGRCR